MAGPIVHERDHGYQALKRRWLQHRNGRVTAVGIFGEGAAEGHGDVTNLLVALVHEYGAPAANIPSRSWLRAWVDENADEVRRRVRELGKRILRGELDADQALEQLGLWIVGSIQARIANKIPPPLAPSTVAARQAKGHGDDMTPLIDSGQFRQAITSEVRNR